MTGTLVVCALAAALGTTPSAKPAPLPHVIEERTIPLVEVPVDIRWLNDDEVIVVDPMHGVARVPVTDRKAAAVWLDEWPCKGAMCVHLAVSPDAVVVGSAFFAIRWRPRRGTPTLHTWAFEHVNDLDLDGDRILITGTHRDEYGKWAGDGGLAFLGSLSEGEKSLRPILPLEQINLARNCGLTGLGKARFLDDGSFIIVPGVQKGIYHFTKSGTVDRVWQTADLGLDVDCGMPDDQAAVLTTQPLARARWVNRHPMVDEIITTPGGPALVVRRVSEGVTRWELLLLNGPSPTVVKLPFTSPSPWAHVEAAVRGKRTAFIMGDRLENRPDGAPTRLILIDWKSN